MGPGYEYIEDFKSKFGKMYENLSPQSKKVLDDFFTTKGFGDGKAIAVQSSAYGLLQRINQAYVDLPDLVKGYDAFLNTWKSVTLLTPGFHMRNLFGNMTNMYLAGMNTAQQGVYATKAMTDFSNWKRIRKAMTEFGGSADEFFQTLSKADQGVYQRLTDFFESGVSQSYAGIRDLGSVKKTLEKGRASLSSKAVGLNFDIAESMDDFQRYMLYQWSFDANYKKLKGTISEQTARLKARAAAYDTTAKSLFDYSNLTSFEQQGMKRIFPFYTFMKNNLVFQMKNIFENPGAYGRLGRAYKYYTEDVAGVDTDTMPDYMLDNMWIPIPGIVTKDDKEAITFLKANLPAAEFFEIVENPFKRGVTSISAPIKLALELGAGVDFFTGSPIREFPGERSRMEEGTGLLSAVRNERGDLALFGDPVIQKIGNDLGLRAPRSYATALFDIADIVAGENPTNEGMLDLLERAGISTAKDLSSMELTRLYQDLERLRNIRSRWEQDTGQELPTKAELGLP
jgi:hypothetical protein